MDYSSLTDDELLAHWQAAGVERERRQRLATLPDTITELIDTYQRALGRSTGADWSQPQGAHDAYPEGAIVTHDGQTWRSTIPANVWPPGVHGWVVDEDAEPAPQPDAPAWEPGIAYQAGDLVDYQGTVYRVLQPHTSAAHWAPPDVPALYVVA